MHKIILFPFISYLLLCYSNCFHRCQTAQPHHRAGAAVRGGGNRRAIAPMYLVNRGMCSFIKYVCEERSNAAYPQARRLPATVRAEPWRMFTGIGNAMERIGACTRSNQGLGLDGDITEGPAWAARHLPFTLRRLCLSVVPQMNSHTLRLTAESVSAAQPKEMEVLHKAVRALSQNLK